MSLHVSLWIGMAMCAFFAGALNAAYASVNEERATITRLLHYTEKQLTDIPLGEI